MIIFKLWNKTGEISSLLCFQFTEIFDVPFYFFCLNLRQENIIVFYCFYYAVDSLISLHFLLQKILKVKLVYNLKIKLFSKKTWCTEVSFLENRTLIRSSECWIRLRQTNLTLWRLDLSQIRISTSLTSVAAQLTQTNV